MAYVQQHRNATGQAVKNAFDKVPTEGDVTKFFGAENGHRQLIHTGDATVLSGGLNRVVTETGSHLFNLDFQYIVSANQLRVLIPVSTTEATFREIPSIDLKNQAATTQGFPSGLLFNVYYEEVGSSSVRVYGLTAGTGVVLFEVPHTSIPATTRYKVIVADQGSNQAVELLGLGDGVLFRSTDGRRWLVRVDSNGSIVSEPR